MNPPKAAPAPNPEVLSDGAPNPGADVPKTLGVSCLGVPKPVGALNGEEVLEPNPPAAVFPNPPNDWFDPKLGPAVPENTFVCCLLVSAVAAGVLLENMDGPTVVVLAKGELMEDPKVGVVDVAEPKADADVVAVNVEPKVGIEVVDAPKIGAEAPPNEWVADEVTGVPKTA